MYLDREPIIVDLETAPLLNAAEFFEPVVADKKWTEPIMPHRGLVDPVKIAANLADVAKRTAEQADGAAQDIAEKMAAVIAKWALDWNLARIVVMGWWWDEHADTRVTVTEDDEADAIRHFWREADKRIIVGFCIRTFDLPLLIQRSRYLGLTYPSIDLGRYAKSGRVVDLYDLLTFQDSQSSYVMRRTVQNFARRIGIPVTDPVKGEDVLALIAAGDYLKVAEHCASDVRLELAIARWLGVVPKEESVVRF